MAPASSTSTASATIHALSAGFITLPAKVFVQPASEDERLTVPSLSFLIQHLTSPSARPTRLVFDLGIRRTHTDYPAPLVQHLKSREPFVTRPDVSESLAAGGLASADDIDLVALSHVHWDHVGTPSDFKRATFVVGHGSIALLAGGGDGASGGHAHFEKDLLPAGRTVELPAPAGDVLADGSGRESALACASASAAALLNPDGLRYETLGYLPRVVDLFGTGLVYLVDAPGHLQGHQNLLVRKADGSWVYLAGDAAHDRRLLRGTHAIATWAGPHGKQCSIHHDDDLVRETLGRIRRLEEEGLLGHRVEVVFAHDVEWLDVEDNKRRFWPGSL